MSDDQKNKVVDEVTGIETTGHEWDGLRELNNPLPRWWLWILYVSIIWSVWYWVVYPAWPTLSGSTEGTGSYTQFNELEANQNEIVERQRVYLDRFEDASFKDIMNDEELYAFAMAGGASVFKDNCATCHGTGGAGAPGYPNLNDDDWIWGGQLSDIHQTIKYGIRVKGSFDTRQSQMPAFGKDGLLKRDEIDSVVDYVLSMSGGKTHGHEVQGKVIFKQQCASCHGEDGKGLKEFGAPNLTDKIWLYGGDRDSIYTTVFNSRAGMMPAWGTRLDENTLKQLTVFLHQLGGGEEDTEYGAGEQ
ncbi:MAG: cytochrome-c oxidase, cbb3-type subunit III [Alphaproteobacteria bacterium]